MEQIENSQLQFIAELKNKVRQAQYEALKAVNVNWYCYLTWKE